jgi:lysozyme
MSKIAIFRAVREILVSRTGKGFTQEEVNKLDAAFLVEDTAPVVSEDQGAKLTLRVAMEVINHEAIVQEAYKDSKGIWTWGIGVTNASGHNIDRYKDNPQSIGRCIAVYLWLLETNYIPAVLRAFKGYELSEAQFAAAVSFAYNTGKIETASWPKLVKQGRMAEARNSMLEWRNPPEVFERRKEEVDLFFNGNWSNDGTTTVWPVSKPAYRPNWSKGRKVNVQAEILDALKES